MGVRIQELPETTGIKKEDVLIVEDGQGTKKGTVQQLDETLGVSQLKEDLVQLQKNQPITLNLEWELGSVNSDGTDGGNTFWIRTKWKTDFDGLRTNISVDDGFQYALITYHSDGSATRTAFRTEPLEVECEIGEMCRIMVSKVAYETSTLDFANHVHINSIVKITEEIANAIALAKNAIEDVSELSENHTNLFDYTKATLNKAVLKDNGTLMDIDGWLVSDYIPVSKNETLFLSIDGVKTNFSTLALYDMNKSYVSGFGGTVDTVSYTPTVDGYIRFSKSHQMNYEKIKLEKNGVTKFTEYDEPYVLVTKQSLPEGLGQSKIYEGKNILTLGDSITAMGGNQGWTNWLKLYVNANKLVNVSVAGATWKDKVEDQIYDGNPQPSTDGNCIGNQVQKVINSKNNGESDYQDFDIIIIAAGTNDPYDSTSETIDTVESQFVSDYSQGNYAVVPLANVNRRTFAGIMRYTYQKLHELYPNADFFICTPIQECYENFVYIKNKGDYLNYIADRLSINTINVRRCGILNIYESQTSTIDYDNPSYEESSNKEDLIDGIHTDVTGAKKMARYIARDIINFYAIN
jgi:lysophospholipase L1-like esterase